MSDTILMKVGDGSKVAGENTLQKPTYDKHLQLLSYSHNVQMPMADPISNAKRTQGTARVGIFTINKKLDATTPKWNQYCLQATNLGDVVITLIQNDGDKVIEMMKYTLSDALVASVSVGGGGVGLPTETIQLTFTKIAWAYTVQTNAAGPGGNVPTTWDLTTNAPAAA